MANNSPPTPQSIHPPIGNKNGDDVVFKMRQQLKEQLRPIDYMCGDKNVFLKIRQQLRENLLSLSDSFRGHKKEWSEIQDLVHRTVTMGESNSVLIVGPIGSGKTTLINCVLKDLKKKKSLQEHWLEVNLNGLLHTTDSVALQAATLQMGLENVVDGKVFGSFAENLKFLFDSLKAGDKEHSKAVIFVLEEFDLFCDHHNQSLLYNLFDVAQSQQAPICVIGLTCRLDVTELLEKRVKSRFSHRQVYLFPAGQDLAEYQTLFKELLRLRPSSIFHVDTTTLWNEHIKALAANASVKLMLKRMYNFNVSEAVLRTFLMAIICKVNNDHPHLLPTDFTDSYVESTVDGKTHNIEDLSVLEVCLLIAIKHHTEIYDGQPFNFEVILRRYYKFLRQNTTPQTRSRPLIMEAFENLTMLDFVEPIGKARANTLQEYQLCNLMVFPSQITNGLKRYKMLPTEVEQWAMSSLQ